MSLYFSIVFIAELIVAFAIIFVIVLIDKKITKLNQELVTKQNELKMLLTLLRNTISNLKCNISVFARHLERKREDYIFKTVRSIILYLCVLCLKGKYKKSVMIFELILEIADYIRKIGF